MVASYLMAFCQMVIGIVFAWSFVGKVRGFKTFEESVANFKLLPKRWSAFLACLVLLGELTVVISMITGGLLLLLGFLLATLILLVFCVVLASALIRQIRVSCNCFGPSQKLVSLSDILRNIGFILCAISGCGIAITQNISDVLNIWAWVLTALAATTFVAVWVQVEEIVYLFRQLRV